MTQRLFKICQPPTQNNSNTTKSHTEEEERLYFTLFQIERNLYESADCGGTLKYNNSLLTRKREKERERERDIPYTFPYWNDLTLST